MLSRYTGSADDVGAPDDVQDLEALHRDEGAHLERARLVVVAAPDAYQARAILQLARRINPDVDVVVRTHSDAERAFLEENGATQALVGERELAVSLTRAALKRSGVAFDMEKVAGRALRSHRDG
jgi:monovalent cation:H+ antiporter-2, CPA2 family